MTLKEIEDNNPEAFKFIFDIAFDWVKEKIKTDGGKLVANKQGLEGTIESVLSLIEKKVFHIVYDKKNNKYILI